MPGNVFHSTLNDLINELTISNLVYSYLLGPFHIQIIPDLKLQSQKDGLDCLENLSIHSI